MSTPAEIKTTYFGLRDFLFYLVPGSVVLLAILFFAGFDFSTIGDYGNLTTSVFGIIFAYCLGHVIYPLTYLVRRWLLHPLVEWLKSDDVAAEDELRFKNRHQRAIENHSLFYTEEISRASSLARFASAMVVPCILLGGGVMYFMSHYSGKHQASLKHLAVPALLLGIVAAAGFGYRYGRYNLRFRRMVMSC